MQGVLIRLKKYQKERRHGRPVQLGVCEPKFVSILNTSYASDV